MSLRPPPPRPGQIRGAGRVRAPAGNKVNHDQQGLDKLTLAVNQIQKHNASSLSFEEHYRHAYQLVLHKKGHELYNQVAQLISAHLTAEAKAKIVPVFPPHPSGESSSSNITQAAAGQLFLDNLRALWDDHLACMSKLRDVLKYMDKVYTGSSHLPHTWDLGLSLFFQHVVLYTTQPVQPPAKPTASSSRQSSSAPAPPTKLPTADPASVAHHLVRALLTAIRIERQGEVVSRHSIRGNVEILCELTDQGPIPLPIHASAGVGSGAPVFGVGSGGVNARARSVMGLAPPGELDSPYKTSFERVFLSQSEEFYAKESARLLVECDCPSFLVKIERRLDEEATRAQSYLHASTEPLLIALLEKTLIGAHLDEILAHPASGLRTLLQDSRIPDLARLYTLFGRVAAGHAALRAGVAAWIVEVGKQVNEGLSLAGEEGEGEPGVAVKQEDGVAPAKPKPRASEGPINAKAKAALGWVQNVLNLKDKFDAILANAFALDKEFEKTINDAFSAFVNANPKSPEYISLFVDENLKKGLKGKSEDEVDEILNKAISLFRFLTEKDLFEKYYNTHLAKRLISQRSVSDDAEHTMLQKFKVEAGAAFTKSAEGMLKDVKISEDMLQAYRRHQDRLEQGQRAPLEMSTIVCGQNFWPFGTSKDAACQLPQVLQKGVAAFGQFYSTKHSGRKLSFRPELGNVEVKARFKARSHELTVSTHGMVVLALFESLKEGETLSYTNIAAETRMAAGELKRTLQTFACAKYKILTKHPKGREVEEADVFAFNHAFTCPMAKIKITTIAVRVETSDERKETEVKVDEARNTQCDAAIVRIMKDRKALLHADLVNEVVRQLSARFQPRPAMIKLAIERMIDKEYLERDGADRKRLLYLA